MPYSLMNNFENRCPLSVDRRVDLVRRAARPASSLTALRVRALQCGPSDDIPELDFVYGDADSLEREISELYSFTELPEFALNQQVSRRSHPYCTQLPEFALNQQVS